MDNKEDMDETNAADESLQFKLIRRMIKRLVITVIRILRLRLFNPPTDKIDSSCGRGSFTMILVQNTHDGLQYCRNKPI